MTKAVSILGSTGSIGRQSIAAAEHLGLPVAALTANRKTDMLEQQARRLKPEFVAVYDEKAAAQLKLSLADTDIRVGSGMEGLIEAATIDAADCVVTAVSGSVGGHSAGEDRRDRRDVRVREVLAGAWGAIFRRIKTLP